MALPLTGFSEAVGSGNTWEARLIQLAEPTNGLSPCILIGQLVQVGLWNPPGSLAPEQPQDLAHFGLPSNSESLSP